MDSVIDHDALSLATELEKRGWVIPSEKLTTRMGHGDLMIITPNGVKCLFEISRWRFPRESYSRNREATFLLGKLVKCLPYAKKKKICNVYLIFRARATLPMLEKISTQLTDIIGVQIILLRCDFKEGWEQSVSEMLQNFHKQSKIQNMISKST